MPVLINGNGGLWWGPPSSGQWDVGWWGTRQLAAGSQIDFAADGTYYITYNMRRRNDDAIGFGLATGSDPASQFISVGATWNNTSFNPPANRKLVVAVGTLNVGQGPYGANAYSPTEVNNDDRNLILIKITTSATGDDTVQAAFFNATRTGYQTLPPNEADVVWDVSYSFDDANTYTHLLAYVNGPTSSGELDAFRLGTAYGDVVQITPVITAQPSPSPASSVFTGTTVSMSVTATGGAPLPLSYQWFKDVDPVENATEATLVLSNAVPTDSGDYYVQVSNDNGSVLSITNTITVEDAPPLLTQDIAPATRYRSGTAVFAPIIEGTAPFQFQWEHDGTPITDATNVTLTLTNLQTADAGNYTLYVTNQVGWTNSSTVGLTLLAVTAGSFEDTIITNQPLAYWRLNETDSALTAYDYFGGNDATNDQVTYVAGPRPPLSPGFESDNNAASYDGTNTSASTSTSASLINDRTQFTIMGWFNPSVMPQMSGDSARVGLFGQNDVAEFGFHTATDLGIWTPATGLVAFDPTSLISAGQWYFLAAVGDGTQLTLYRNGSPIASALNTTNNYGSSPSPFRIGAAVLDATGNYFSGAIDEVAVFDHALSAETINAIYAQGAGEVGATIIYQPTSQTRYAGQSVSFQVTAVGTLPINYQWYHDNNPLTDNGSISGANSATLTIANVTGPDAGEYFVGIENDSGFDDSIPALLTVLVPAENGYASEVLTQDPVGFWPLDEAVGATTAYDYWGGHNGTYDAGAVPGAPGPQFGGFEADNTAVQLTGVAGSRVALPALNLYTNTVTIAGWIYPDGDQGGWRGIVFSRAGSTVAGVHYGDGNELRFTWNNANATWGWNSELIVPTNQWSFVALVVTPTNGTLYLGTDGILQSAVRIVANDIEEFNGTTYIGEDTSAGTRLFNGIIDDVAIYNQALSLAAIGNLYLNGSGETLALSLTATEGPAVLDSKPVGLPHDGLDNGTAWLDSETDNISTTRSGVAQFVAPEGDQIVLPAHPDFDGAQGTIAFWMRTAGNDMTSGSEGSIIFDRRTSEGDVIVMKDDGTLFVQNNGGGNSFVTANTVNDNDWHHVAYVYDQSAAGSISIYLDGVLDTSQGNSSAWIWPVKQSIEIGRSHDGYWRTYNGSLDDFRIYDRMLDESELTAIVSGDDAELVAPDALMVRLNFDAPPQGSSLLLSWPYGILEEAEDILGPWYANPDASAPWQVPAVRPLRIFRVMVP